MSVVVHGGSCPGCCTTVSIRAGEILCDACLDKHRPLAKRKYRPPPKGPQPPPRPKPAIRIEGGVPPEAPWVLGFCAWAVAAAVTLTWVFGG